MLGKGILIIHKLTDPTFDSPIVTVYGSNQAIVFFTLQVSM